MKLYEVAVTYTGQVNYLVRAETLEVAEEIARSKFYENEEADLLGTEWERVQRLRATPVIATTPEAATA